MFASEKAGLPEKIGKMNLQGNIDDALSRAREITGLPVEKIEYEAESSIEKKK